MNRWKVLAAVLLSILMILSVIPSGAVHAAETSGSKSDEQYIIKVQADKQIVSAGDIVGFSVTLGPVDHIGTMQMVLDIPEGLEYVANSCELADGLKTALGYDTLEWIENTKMIHGYASAADYACSEDTLIATFQCKVGADFKGHELVSLDDIEFFSCQTWISYTSCFSIIPAFVMSDTLTKIPAQAPTATEDGNIEYYTCSDCSKLFAEIDGVMTEVTADDVIVESLHKQFVRQMYSNALGRELNFDDPVTGEADRIGFKSFTDALDAGMTGAEVASKFIFSGEMWAKNLCNDCFIKALYRTILNREPDTVGMDYWKSVLEYAGKTRIEAFNMFVLPDGGVNEFKNYCERYGVNVALTPITTFEPTAYGLVPMGRCVCGRSNVDDFVTYLYRNCLNREPDAEGLNSWMAGLYDPDSDEWTGYSVAYRFVFGDANPEGNHEFTELNLCNDHYVRRLYKALLGRTDEMITDAEVAGYVNALDAGMTREEVFDKFVTSDEFKLMCVRAGIDNGLDKRYPIPAMGEGTVQNGPCQETGCGKEPVKP